MKVANSKLIETLKIFLGFLPSMKNEKVLDVGCGECHVSKEVFAKRFMSIDLLDRCPLAIQYA